MESDVNPMKTAFRMTRFLTTGTVVAYGHRKAARVVHLSHINVKKKSQQSINKCECRNTHTHTHTHKHTHTNTHIYIHSHTTHPPTHTHTHTHIYTLALPQLFAISFQALPRSICVCNNVITTAAKESHVPR